MISGDIEIPEEFDYEKDGIIYHYRVTEIGEWAFYNCRDLTGITIPGSVTSIGQRAFQDCRGLTGITIPDGVESIESSTFQDCRGLTSVTIPGSVTSIKGYAFYDCSGLTGITIPDNVTSIEYLAFCGCSSLTSITIPDGMKSLTGNIFQNCTALTSVTIPDSVESIEQGAFFGCSSLTSIKLPKDVKRIEFSAFEGCSALTSIFIPENMLLIGAQAFWGCENLKDLYIVVLSGGSNLLPRQVVQNPFDSLPDEEHKRNIHFVNANGTELTGQLYDDAFDYAAAHDNDPADGKWYGWSYNGLKNGGDIPNPNPDPNPNPGGDNPGGNGGFGGGTGDNDSGGGSSGGMGDHSKPDSDSTETEQIAVVSAASSPQVEKAVVADTGTSQSPGGQTAGANGTTAGGKEPKTGDTAYWEVYATLAMVAGLTYLLLYIMEESRGMSEREKEAFVAAFIRWGKKGGAFRKCCAMAAIFCLLAYYHTIGKRAGGSVLRERYLGQVS